MAVSYVDGAGVGYDVDFVPSTGPTTTFTIPVPSGGGALVAGDLLIAVVSVDIASTTLSTRTLPSGWTSLTGQVLLGSGTTTAQHEAIYHFVTSGEAGTTPSWVYVPNGATASEGNVAVSRFRGVDTTSPFALASPFFAGTMVTTGAKVAPAVTTTVANAMLVTGFGIRNGSLTLTDVTPGYTPGGNAILGQGRSVALAHKLQAATGASTTASWNMSATTNPGYAWQSALRPSTGPAAPVLNSRVVGVPDTTSAKVSVNVSNATSARLKVGTDTGVTTGVIFGSAVAPNAQGDATLPVTGLTAGTRYYYRVEMTDSASGTSLDTGTVGTFRAAPSGASSFAFCFGSCTNGTDSAAMSAIAARGDDLFFHLGDLYYNDGGGTTVATFRTQMANKIAAANHAAVFATTPSTYTPSDHDGMSNDGNAGTDATAWTNWNSVYREKWPTPTLPTGGVYYAFTWGRVRFIQIDRRSFATIPSATDNSSKTCLGATQKQWLKDQITNATEPVIVIIQEAPWIESATAGEDAWAGYSTERTELANFFSASGKNIGMLAGDMHAVAADNGTNAPGGIFLFHAAPLNNTASQKGGPYTTGPFPASGAAVVQQYGRVVVTDTGGSISLAFTGYSSANASLATLTETFTTGGSLTQTGSGTLTLDGIPKAGGGLAVTGSGTTTWGGGPRVGGDLARTGTGTATFGGAAVSGGGLAVSGSGTTTFGTATIGAKGTLTQSGSGTLTLTPVSNFGTGPLNVSGSGTLALAGSPRTSGTLARTGTGTLTLGGSPRVTGPLSRSGTGTLLLTPGGITTRLKQWDGSGWGPTLVKKWDGTSWVFATVRVWNGSAWF